MCLQKIVQSGLPFAGVVFHHLSLQQPPADGAALLEGLWNATQLLLPERRLSAHEHETGLLVDNVALC